MITGECIRMSLDNIRSNKIRSFLTLLGIMIGVTAVIALISTVSTVSGSLASSFRNMGVGTLTVSVTGSDLKTGMTADDLARVTALEEVDGLTPNVTVGVTSVSYGNTISSDLSVSGRNAYYFILNKDIVKQGRTLKFFDDDNARHQKQQHQHRQKQRNHQPRLQQPVGGTHGAVRLLHGFVFRLVNRASGLVVYGKAREFHCFSHPVSFLSIYSIAKCRQRPGCRCGSFSVSQFFPLVNSPFFPILFHPFALY